MNFKDAVADTRVITRTENGMVAFDTSCDNLVDLFYKAPSSRGQEMVPAFIKAYHESPTLAMRFILWLRDIRGGAGERDMARSFLSFIENNYPEMLTMEFLAKIPFVGRWDDLLYLETAKGREMALDLIDIALASDDLGTAGLCAKWMPRKGPKAIEIRNHLNLTPKQYRKTLVSLTNVVEQKMSAKDWDSIEYGKLPSRASALYTKAFKRHSNERYHAYLLALQAGTAKVNAGAVYPHEVVGLMKKDNKILADSMWEALPDYMTDANIMSIVDVSGSMTTPSSAKGYSCMDIALALGLYTASKNKGGFKDLWMSFSGTSKINISKGSLSDRYRTMQTDKWAMDTNLNAAFENILKTGLTKNVPDEEMPKILLILSDMQFNQCARYDDSAINMIRRKYEEAGYTMPKIVFWNLASKTNNIPVKFDENGTALVAGFSPSVLKAILKADLEQFTPKNIAVNTLMAERYAY